MSLPRDFVDAYIDRLNTALKSQDWSVLSLLAEELRNCWRHDRQVFLCGNGGSAANAMHLANDFLYGVATNGRRGLRVTALPANTSVLTCLANDVSYEEIFSQQLRVLGRSGDLVIVFSGSGNSANVLRCLEVARELKLKSFAVVGFDGGRALSMADHSIHFPVNDMQVSEDLQLMVGHLLMQWLGRQPVNE